jgi:hypothetical protein
MKKFNTQDAKEIGDDLAIDWNTVTLDEFTMGLNAEIEYGTRFPETIAFKKLVGKIVRAHLNEHPDYYTRLEKMVLAAAEF